MFRASTGDYNYASVFGGEVMVIFGDQLMIIQLY